MGAKGGGVTVTPAIGITVSEISTTAVIGTLAEALEAIRAFDPDAPLVLSLGFDTYHADPICNLALRTEDYARIGSAVSSLGMPVVALQEGGYAVDALGANAVAFLGAMRGTIPTRR